MLLKEITPIKVYVMKKYGDMGWRYKFKILFNKTKKISKLWK